MQKINFYSKNIVEMESTKDPPIHHFTARARLMIQLGDQLITDEVAAVSELVKNSYDADAKIVEVHIENAMNTETGKIRVIDWGIGMDLPTIEKGWLEVATVLKSREQDEKPRLTLIFKRPILGEKGLGRLSVHKLGLVTEIVSRARSTNDKIVEKEVVLRLDWTAFEDSQKFLEEIPVDLSERTPEVFTGLDEEGKPNHGTQITITKLKRAWTTDMLKELYLKSQIISSPISGTRNFEVVPYFKELNLKNEELVNYREIARNSIYSFQGNVSTVGELSYHYMFAHPNYPELKRAEDKKTPILDPENFPSNRKPLSGPFALTLYSWELRSEDKRLVFGDAKFFRDVVEPNTGVKVYRDSFRVLPYGDEDNDWLGLDQRRTRRFALHVSRNQVIGFVDITAEGNPGLIDKSDREGLIDNDQYRDFCSLVLNAFRVFENLRLEDRERIKAREGRTQEARREKFGRGMSKLQAKLNEPAFQKIPAEKRLELQDIVTETRSDFESILEETEQPLLVAAGIGLSVLIPTHEVRRGLLESIKLLKTAMTRDPDSRAVESIQSALTLLEQIDKIIGGLVKLQQKSGYDERFPPEKAIEFAETLYGNRLKRRNIEYTKDLRIQFEISGSSRQLALVIENMLDNSAYWLDRNQVGQRHIKIITDNIDGNPAIIVSDDGPGIEEDIDTITLPFITRKPKGLGLGLFIARRIAENHDSKLVLLNQGDLPGLLSGANIGIVFLQKAPIARAKVD